MSLTDDLNAQAWRELEQELQRRLEELGPGWAVGWRLKDVGETGNLMDTPSVTRSYEYHSVELVDGKVAYGLSDFHYVTMPK